MLRLVPFAAVAGALFAVTSSATAAPTGRLVYSRSGDARSCPDEATLRRAVAARVGYDAFFPWAKRTVIANVERRGHEFVATVSLVDEQGIAHGARELRTGGDCAELLDAAALTIAIAIDPEIFTRPATPVPEAQQAPGPDVQETPAMPALSPRLDEAVPSPHPAGRRAPRPPPPGEPLTFEASAGVLASSGSAPDLAVGLSTGAALRWSDLSIGVEGRVDAPASRSAQGGGEVSSWRVAGALVPCAHFGAFLACAVAQGGAMRVSSDGVADRRSTWTSSWQAGGRVGALLAIAENGSLRVHWDLLTDIDRASLDLRGVSVWTAPVLASSLGVDAVLRFR